MQPLTETEPPTRSRPRSGSLGAALSLARAAAIDACRGHQRSVKARGMALLMTVVVTAILASLAVQFTYNTRANLWMTGNLKASTQAYFNARSATRIALLAVNAKRNFPQMQQFMQLMGRGAAANIEVWQRACDFVNIFATGKAEFFGTQLLDFSAEQAVGAPSKHPDKAAFTCKVTAEDARVSLNRAATDVITATEATAPPPTAAPGLALPPPMPVDPGMVATQQLQSQQRNAGQLYIQLAGMLQPMVAQGLFKSEDAITDLILNVVDWTDADESKSDLDPQGNFTVSGGAEPDYGRYGYKSKNARMDTVGELQLVEGMTPDVFCRVRDKLTVFGTEKVNVNDADLAVLKGILCQSITDDVARAMVCFQPDPSGLSAMDQALVALESCRNLKKQVYSTPFTSMSRFTQFFQELPAALGAAVQFPINPNLVNQQLGVRTKMVRIEAEGVYADSRRKMVAIVDTASGALVHYHYE
jgi:type II secretory pathway component PulK